MNIMSRLFLFTTLSLLLAAPAFAADLHLAVAANFTAPMEQLKPLFEKATGHKLIISYGTVGKFRLYRSDRQGTCRNLYAFGNKTY